MGTSKAYSLPTTGNWPDMKRNVTDFASSGGAGGGGVQGLLDSYVRARGGPNAAAQQMAAASGAGARLAGFLTSVSRQGLERALEETGLTELAGKTGTELLSAVRGFLVGPGSLMDDDIARWALIEYLNEVFGACHSVVDWESAVARLLENGLGRVLRHFFGLCIFRRFLADFSERLAKASGGVRSTRRLVRDIRAYILSKLNTRTFGRPLADVDWRGSEGVAISQEVLASTWRVFGGA